MNAAGYLSRTSGASRFIRNMRRNTEGAKVAIFTVTINMLVQPFPDYVEFLKQNYTEDELNHFADVCAVDNAVDLMEQATSLFLYPAQEWEASTTPVPPAIVEPTTPQSITCATQGCAFLSLVYLKMGLYRDAYTFSDWTIQRNEKDPVALFTRALSRLAYVCSLQEPLYSTPPAMAENPKNEIKEIKPEDILKEHQEDIGSLAVFKLLSEFTPNRWNSAQMCNPWTYSQNMLESAVLLQRGIDTRGISEIEIVDVFSKDNPWGLRAGLTKSIEDMSSYLKVIESPDTSYPPWWSPAMLPSSEDARRARGKMYLIQSMCPNPPAQVEYHSMSRVKSQFCEVLQSVFDLVGRRGPAVPILRPRERSPTSWKPDGPELWVSSGTQDRLIGMGRCTDFVPRQFDLLSPEQSNSGAMYLLVDNKCMVSRDQIMNSIVNALEDGWMSTESRIPYSSASIYDAAELVQPTLHPIQHYYPNVYNEYRKQNCPVEEAVEELVQEMAVIRVSGQSSLLRWEESCSDYKTPLVNIVATWLNMLCTSESISTEQTLSSAERQTVILNLTHESICAFLDVGCWRFYKWAASVKKSFESVGLTMLNTKPDDQKSDFHLEMIQSRTNINFYRMFVTYNEMAFDSFYRSGLLIAWTDRVIMATTLLIALSFLSDDIRDTALTLASYVYGMN